MSLQNRVNPFGELIATSARGLFMGNRGGRLHDAGRSLLSKRWISRRWICCILKFNNRHRTVWGDGYTELFFLDEVTAFAAGHRPCFECRWRDAQLFAALWARTEGRDTPPGADDIDRALHRERLAGRYSAPIDSLPDGTMIVLPGQAAPLALRGGMLLRWTPRGYDDRAARPHGITVDALTSPAVVKVLAQGYRPVWHPSAA
jgi:hypothetical protein